MINYSASIKISQLSELTGSNITMDDFVPVVDSGSMITERVSLGDLKLAIFATASIGADTNIIFQSSSALSASNNLRYDYVNQILHVTKSIVTPSLTGSVYGTASWAANVVSASYATTSSNTTMYPDIYDVAQKVGIRNAAPQYALDINGNIGSSNTGYLNVASDIILPSRILNDSRNTAGNGCNFIGTGANVIITAATLGSRIRESINTIGVDAGRDIFTTNNEVVACNFIGTGAGVGVIGQPYVSASVNINQNHYNNFFGQSAGSGATYVRWCNFIGAFAGRGAVSASRSNFFGTLAGDGSTNSYDSVFIGNYAGAGNATAYGSTFIGDGAGNNDTGFGSYTADLHRSVLIGQAAGASSISQSFCTYIGNEAGNGSQLGSENTYIGFIAGRNSLSSSNCVYIGTYSGLQATGSNNVFIGGAGTPTNATSDNRINANNAVFIGSSCGEAASYANESIFIGRTAGLNAISASNSVFIGTLAGAAYSGSIDGYSNASSSVFIGPEAGLGRPSASYMGNYIPMGPVNTPGSVFIGAGAGFQSDSSSLSVFVGAGAGRNALSSNNCIFIGNCAGENDAANNLPDATANRSAGYELPNTPYGHYNILIGDYTNTNGFGDSICIGRGTAAFQTRSLNIANVIYGTEINNTASFYGTSSLYNSGSIPQQPFNARIGIGTNSPLYTLDVVGTMHGTGFIFPTSQPSNPVAGSAYLDTVTNKLYIFNGSTWKTSALT